MCGICGIASRVGAARPRPAGDDERHRSSHRGPDSGGEHLDGPVALAARRLSIIDLAGGDQPISSEDGSCVVVQNGEIYNYPELRRELERDGHTFRTRCDTEVHLHLYERYGPDFARRLRGMFAVAIWDARRRRLVLARDRYGIKPLYYRDAGGELEFASELRALPRGEIDLDALEAFLAFNSIPAPYSIFRDVRKLPAGHVLVWEEDGATWLDRYARPGPVPADELRRDDEAELVEELRARLRDSVRAHLLADVPSACCSRAASTRPCSPRSPRRRPRDARPHVHDRLRGAQLRRARRRPARRASATARTTTSCSSGRSRSCSCRRSPTRSTSRSPTRPRCRRTSSRSSPPST